MWRVTLKGLLAHKLRLALTALAIVLGVGFVAGTYVLTDTINKTFTELFEDIAKGTDVAIRGKEEFSSDQGEQRSPIPAAVRDQIAGVDGVKAAEGSVSGYAQFIGKNGKPVTTGGAPTLGVSVSTTPELRQSITLRSGTFPTGPSQVVVDARTASKQGFTVGGKVRILFQKAPRDFTVSGVVGFGEADNLAGATLAGFDTATAQDVLNRRGVFDEIDVVAAPGVSHEALRDRISARIGPTYEALTGKQLADENAKAIGQFTKFINIALLAFAFVSLFVGSFIIVNTFSIILAQRTRELALLRCMGASRRQLMRSPRGAPVAAVQEATTLAPTRTGKVRIAVGAVMTVVGVALLLTGLFNDKASNRLATVATGAVVIFLGVAVLSPLVARPMSRVLGWPFAHWAGEPGKLARQNAMRIPRRTASTAAALMIGLALVSLVTIFAASLKASFTKILDDAVAADYILSGPSGGAGVGFSPDVVQQLSRQPQVESAVGIRTGTFKLDGKNEGLNGVDPIAYDKTIRTETTEGKITDLGSGGIAVLDDVAKDHGWKLGDSVSAQFPVGGTERLPIKAIYKDNQLNGNYLIPLGVYQRHYQDQLDVLALVKAKQGVPPAESRAAIDKVVAQFPTVQVRDQAEFKDEQAKQINQILVLFYILLALAIVIAFIGIINTLALSVLERIRELGLLRAVGMTRGQLRAMIRWEAVIISVLGAVLGMAVGIFFGWTLVSSLKSQGITEFELPVGTLIALVVAAGLVGVVSAILPGRRAARIDVLRAVTTE